MLNSRTIKLAKCIANPGSLQKAKEVLSNVFYTICKIQNRATMRRNDCSKTNAHKGLALDALVH